MNTLNIPSLASEQERTFHIHVPWDISEDKLTIVFTLREGLKWSDGEPLTADDVIFSYNDLYLNEKIQKCFQRSFLKTRSRKRQN